MLAQKKREEWIKERMQQNKVKRDADFNGLLNTLKEGKVMVDAIDRYVHLHQDNETQKIQKMHGEWTTNVFDKIQNGIAETLDCVDRKDLNRMKREGFQDFLEAGNTKGALFLDTILDDYDPFKTQKQMPKVRIGKIKDPNRRVLDKHVEEMSAMSNGKIDDRAKSRKVLDVREWAEGKVEATPHGHFAEMMAKDPREHKDPKAHKMTSSDVTFNHFDYHKGRCDEYPRGKRIFLDKANKSSIEIRDASYSK